jgi:hypothetical protein
MASLANIKNNFKIKIESEFEALKFDKIKGTGINETSADQAANMTLLISGNETPANDKKNITDEINAASDETIDEKAVNETKINETFVNVTLNITDRVNVTVNATIINTTVNETRINQTAVNESVINDTINITDGVNATLNATVDNISNAIGIILEYNDDSFYDTNNNGMESISGVIDLTVENTKFNFNVSEKNLCTKWNTLSLDTGESTTVCYGGRRCCSFIGLSPLRETWDEVFYSTYGLHGATLNNIVSSQVIYVDYSLSLENPYSEIYYSSWTNLTARFRDGYVSFDRICIETCALPNLNSTVYSLIFEVENSSLIIDSIHYNVLKSSAVNSKPVMLQNFTDISFLMGQNYTLNLSRHFYDPDGDNMTFDYFKNPDIEVIIYNDTAVFKTDNFTGTSFMFFIANDSREIAISNVFPINVKKSRIFSIPGLKSLRSLIS